MTRLDRSDRRDVATAIEHVIAAVPLARLLEVLQSFFLPLAQQLHSVLLFSDLRPVIESLFRNYKGTPLSEALCRLLPHAIESWKYHLAALAPQILDVSCSAYDETGLACYLWVAKACTSNLGNSDTPEGRAVFAIMVVVIQVVMVINKFIYLTEQEVADAQAKADKIALDCIVNLEATETPESIIVSTVSGEAR